MDWVSLEHGLNTGSNMDPCKSSLHKALIVKMQEIKEEKRELQAHLSKQASCILANALARG